MALEQQKNHKSLPNLSADVLYNVMIYQIHKKYSKYHDYLLNIIMCCSADFVFLYYKCYLFWSV